MSSAAYRTRASPISLGRVTGLQWLSSRKTASPAHSPGRATVLGMLGVPKREFWNNAEPERLPDH